MKGKGKYISNIEDQCPKCGAGYLDYGKEEVDESGLHLCYPWSCKKCGASGIEYYWLTFDGYSVYDDTSKLENVNDYLDPGTKIDF